MKSIFITVLLCILANSCSNDDSLDTNVFPQKWNLVKMTGQIPNSETVGEEMEWQEFYILKQDKSFVKNRERDGITIEVSGTFELIEERNETLFELNFNNDNELIGSCLQGTIETLRLIDQKTIIGTWQACDGPGLEYKLEE